MHEKRLSIIWNHIWIIDSDLIQILVKLLKKVLMNLGLNHLALGPEKADFWIFDQKLDYFKRKSWIPFQEKIFFYFFFTEIWAHKVAWYYVDKKWRSIGVVGIQQEHRVNWPAIPKQCHSLRKLYRLSKLRHTE